MLKKFIVYLPASSELGRSQGAPLALRTLRMPSCQVPCRTTGPQSAALPNIRGQCGRARSFISTGENPVPAGQASHREESLGPAGIIPKVKHRVIEPTGRKQ